MNYNKNNKKAQSALEFTILLGFSLILVSGMFIIMQDNIQSMEEKRETIIVEQMFNLVLSEIEFAQMSKPVYYRTFYLPPSLGGKQYNVTLYDNKEVVIDYMDHRQVTFLIKNTTLSGNFKVPGINTIMKECENCTLTLNTGEMYESKGDEFVSVWNINPNQDNIITLPLIGGGEYDFIVDWGDGDENTITSYSSSSKTHHYEQPGEYTIRISGTIEGWSFGETPASRNNIISIERWGPLRLGNTGGYFQGASNLQITAEDELNLTGTTTFENAFRECSSLTSIPNMNNWDTSRITDMSHMFSNAQEFNGNIQYLDTSHVTDMNRMFFNAHSFNQIVGGWDTSHVTDMSHMFFNAKNFNQHIGQWDILNIKTMDSIFDHTNINVRKYDLILERIYTQVPEAGGPSNINFGAQGLQYCNSCNDRKNLIEIYDWTIQGDAPQPYDWCRCDTKNDDDQDQR